MIQLADLSYVRFRAPDPDRMESFLTDFGLVRSARTATALKAASNAPQAPMPTIMLNMIVHFNRSIVPGNTTPAFCAN